MPELTAAEMFAQCDWTSRDNRNNYYIKHLLLLYIIIII
jgi:hypothetical protein